KIFNDSIIHIFSEMGLLSINLENILNGEVETIAEQISSKLREIFIERKRSFWFAGYGETTTKVIGKGKGGRNLELSLRIMMKMNPEEIFSFISIATDGDDGNSLMMGMITDNILKERTTNVDLEKYLKNSDSATFAEDFGVAVRTGYTGSNVSDIIIGYYGGLIENVNREE
ncbi:glycerate kinase, partial [mine drainage metagenome]